MLGRVGVRWEETGTSPGLQAELPLPAVGSALDFGHVDHDQVTAG